MNKFLSLLIASYIMLMLVFLFTIVMFLIASCEAKAVMGAKDQTPAEKRLSECTNDTDCMEAYDEVFGEGEAAKMEWKLRECGSPSPLAPCPDEEYNIQPDGE
jgi:hypothetical protein